MGMSWIWWSWDLDRRWTLIRRIARLPDTRYLVWYFVRIWEEGGRGCQGRRCWKYTQVDGTSKEDTVIVGVVEWKGKIVPESVLEKLSEMFPKRSGNCESGKSQNQVKIEKLEWYKRSCQQVPVPLAQRLAHIKRVESQSLALPT